METLKVADVVVDIVNSERSKHIESLRATKAKLISEYGQAKSDLLDQIRSVDAALNATLPSMAEIQRNS
jgi:hypothetical protein